MPDVLGLGQVIRQLAPVDPLLPTRPRHHQRVQPQAEPGLQLGHESQRLRGQPYGRFLAACESARYDVELLGHRFGTSFEQTVRPMSTLQREGARGIPFFFMLVDRAGNISKRFSAGRFPFSRFGGTCPLWNIHAAVETPDQVQTQVIRIPEGASYFSVARTVTRAGGSHGHPAQRLAIGLGCDEAYAPRLVYADGIDLDRTRPQEIGLNCYLCRRADCSARAHAPINRRLKVNERERSLAIFRFEGG